MKQSMTNEALDQHEKYLMACIKELERDYRARVEPFVQELVHIQRMRIPTVHMKVEDCSPDILAMINNHDRR